MPTIRQVAKACGVSPMTVSFVLNDKRGQVSEETRERVLRAVREMGYRPAAKEGDIRRVLTLGVVAGVAGDSLVEPGYYNAVLNAMLVAADAAGHNMTLFTSSLLHTDSHQALRVYGDGRCDGLLVLAPRVGSTLVLALHERGFPFVLVGDTGDNTTDSCVDVENRAAGRQATERLLALGHRRVAFVGGPDFVRSGVQRREGYRQALAGAGLEAQEVIGRAGTGSDDHEEKRLIGQMLGAGADARPTALFCWNDGAALQALDIAAGLGLRVPDDLSVIGFDDDWRAQTSDPPLTTMRQPHREIGAQAIDCLAAIIRGEVAGPQRLLLPTEMVTRGSAASAPQDSLTEPLPQGIDIANSRLAPTPANAVAAPGALTQDNKIIGWGDKNVDTGSGGMLGARTLMAWNVWAPEAGPYAVTPNANGPVQVIVDGAPINGPCRLTVGLHSVRLRTGAGSVPVTRIVVAPAAKQTARKELRP